MIARMLSQRRKLMRLTNQLKLSVILIALLLSGCASLQPRLGFKELSRYGQALEIGFGDGLPQKFPVEFNGYVERGSIEFGAKIPVFVW